MKTLIAYFSWSGNTKRLIDSIGKEIEADVVHIERKIPYSEDYDTCAYVEAKKEAEEETFPEIRDCDKNFKAYERILLFFPIWWYTIPRPVATFVRNLDDYEGKVFVFANSYTNDPKYLDNSLEDLKKSNPKIHLVKGLLNKSVRDHILFLEKQK